MKLCDFFAAHPRAAVAFSGGADSAYLLYAAQKNGAQVKGYFVKTAFQPQFELDDALRFAQEWALPVEVLTADVLALKAISDNPPERCYYCKRMLFEQIRSAAAADGFAVLLDGTNASDDANDRPGFRALQELEVLSPLRLCGLTKADIRELSREAGLSTWNKPAYSCLATRIASGETVTGGKLAATEKAERLMSTLGFSNFRVRMSGSAAKIQIPAAQFAQLIRHREEIVRELKSWYSSVLLDLEERQ